VPQTFEPSAESEPAEMTWKVGHGLGAMVYQISIDAVNVRTRLTADYAGLRGWDETDNAYQ
jgi:hypothetical protein